MRPKGTTRAKKPIMRREYRLLLLALSRNTDIKRPTKYKLRAAFTLLYLTGCRISEIARLRRSDIEQMIAHNEYSLTNDTKTAQARLISFDESRAQAQMLADILSESGPEYLFTRNGSDHPMTTEALKNLANGFIHAVLGELYSSHSFRAGYITAFHAQGFSLEHIRTDIGHRSIATTARYATVTPSEISLGKNQREW